MFENCMVDIENIEELNLNPILKKDFEEKKIEIKNLCVKEMSEADLKYLAEVINNGDTLPDIMNYYIRNLLNIKIDEKNYIVFELFFEEKNIEGTLSINYSDILILNSFDIYNKLKKIFFSGNGVLFLNEGFLNGEYKFFYGVYNLLINEELKEIMSKEIEFFDIDKETYNKVKEEYENMIYFENEEDMDEDREKDNYNEKETIEEVKHIDKEELKKLF